MTSGRDRPITIRREGRECTRRRRGESNGLRLSYCNYNNMSQITSKNYRSVGVDKGKIKEIGVTSPSSSWTRVSLNENSEIGGNGV